MHHSVPHTHTTLGGFTLIELMVTLSIIFIAAAVVMFNHARFESSIQMSNLAYEIALSLREAQTFGISVRGSGSSFGVSYGVEVRKNSPTLLTLFADRNNTDKFEPNGPDELIRELTLGRGIAVSDACAKTSTDDFCFSNNGIERLVVLFSRPDPDAIINGGAYGEATIDILSPQGMERTIKATLTGQISVER